MTRTLSAIWTNTYLAALILVIILYTVYIEANDTNKESAMVFKDSETFTLNFLKNIPDLNITKNLVSFPLSALNAISTYAILDKRGNLVPEDTSRFTDDGIVNRQSFQNLLNQLNNDNKLQFKIVNNICTANEIKLKSEYVDAMNSFLHFKICELNSTDPDKSAKSVNEWLDEYTDHMISEIVHTEDITPDVHMMLLNVVYFQGFWKDKFKERTTRFRTFYVDQNIKEYVATMSNIGSYLYGELPDLKAKFVELPYADCNLKMTIIVPNEVDGLKDIVENLESFNQTRLINSGSLQNVYVMLPKFKIESSIDLKETFKQLGMADMLETKENIISSTKESVIVNKEMQKILLDVKEGYDESPAMEFYSDKMKKIQSIIAANRPFLFKIIDDTTNMTLFIGFVANPKIN